MKTKFVMIALLMLILSETAAQKTKKQETDKPNIIFILTDDQRFDAIGFSGNEVYKNTRNG